MIFSSPLQFGGKLFTGFEAGNFPGFDLDYFAGLRVTSIAGSALGNGECAEAYQCHLTTTFQRFGNGFNERI